MKITHFADIPFRERLPRHRDGRFDTKSLQVGTPGTPGNFMLYAVRTFGDFFSPRHKHNFDQVRIQLEGDFDFDRNGKMTPGMIAYFPEGTPYGPQTSSVDSLTLVLQCGGASGSGFLSREEFKAGSEDLEKHGTFGKGAYTWVDDNGQKHNKDGYQAVWEHIMKRPLEYPDPRYQAPVFMNPESFAWVASDRPGVAAKRLGQFSERGIEIGLLRAEPGAAVPLDERSLYAVMSGRGSVGGTTCGVLATLSLDAAETGRFDAEDTVELLRLQLPDLGGVAMMAAAQ